MTCKINVFFKRFFTVLFTVLFTVFLSTFILSGCGASKTSKNPANRGSVWQSQNASTGTTPSLGECNRVSLANVGLQGQIGTYYDPQTHQFQSQYLNLNLKSVPATLFSSDTLQIKIYRWSAQATGGKVVNQVAVKFYFADKLNGATSQPTLIDSLSKATLQQAKTTLGGTWLNVTLEKIFDRVIIVLTGLDLQYDAITFALYDTAVSNTAIATGDVLLPAFYANPSVYQAANPNPDLYTLHPNYPLINSNASEGDYKQAIDSICLEMSGAYSRVPASVGNPEVSVSEPQSFWSSVWQVMLNILDSIRLFM